MGGASVGNGGFTLPELLTVLIVVAIGVAFGTRGLTEYREATATARAAAVLRGDMAMARSYAVRTRGPVSLVARDSMRAYVIRDTSGTIFQRRTFDGRADVMLTSMDVATAGDSMTFNARGILISAGSTKVDVVRGRRSRSVMFNAMGRARVN